MLEEATVRPSGWKARAAIRVGVTAVDHHAPSGTAKSQILTVLSKEPEASFPPSGLKARHSTVWYDHRGSRRAVPWPPPRPGSSPPIAAPDQETAIRAEGADPAALGRVEGPDLGAGHRVPEHDRSLVIERRQNIRPGTDRDPVAAVVGSRHRCGRAAAPCPGPRPGGRPPARPRRGSPIGAEGQPERRQAPVEGWDRLAQLEGLLRPIGVPEPTVPSWKPTDARRWPSGEKATSQTSDSWPRNSWRRFPVATSQIRITRSRPAETSRVRPG